MQAGGKCRWIWDKLTTTSVSSEQVHTLTTTKDVANLVTSTTKVLSKRTFELGVDAEYTHDVLNHRSAECIMKTLENSTCEAYCKMSAFDKRIFEQHLEEVSRRCISCLASTNRRKVMRHKWSMKTDKAQVAALKHQEQLNMMIDTTHNNYQDKFTSKQDMVYMSTDNDKWYVNHAVNTLTTAEFIEVVTPKVMGRNMDTVNKMTRRYDLDTTQIYQVSFADLKSLPDKNYCLTWWDYKSNSTECVVIKSKTSTTNVLRTVLVGRGIHKLPYVCTVVVDSDGANKPISEALALLGIKTMCGIPERQSLNAAERSIGNSASQAKKAILRSKLSPKFLGDAMAHQAQHHNYISCRTRGGLSPNEIVYNKKMDIDHLKPFGALGYAHKSDAKMQDKDREMGSPMEAVTKAEPIILVGYMANMSKTYKVVTTRGSGFTMMSRDIHFMKEDPRDPREINARMFEHTLEETKTWVEESEEPERGDLNTLLPENVTNYMNDEVLLEKLHKYVPIKHGGEYDPHESISDIMKNFNRSRQYLVDQALQWEEIYLNNQPSDRIDEDPEELTVTNGEL